MYINETKLKVRYVETGQMGVVHHSNYYAYFEVARGEFIASKGMSYREVECENIMLPVVETYCKYIEGAKYEDNLIVRTWISEISAVKVVLNYEIVRELDNKIIAKGRTVHAFVNSVEFKIVNLKKNNFKIWQYFENLR